MYERTLIFNPRSELPIIVKMDSMVAVKLIQPHEIDRTLDSSIVRKIRHLMSVRSTCITLVNHTQNKVSDSLAKFARVEGRTITWIGSVPSTSLGQAHVDCNDHDI